MNFLLQTNPKHPIILNTLEFANLLSKTTI